MMTPFRTLAMEVAADAEELRDRAKEMYYRTESPVDDLCDLVSDLAERVRSMALMLAEVK